MSKKYIIKRDRIIMMTPLYWNAISQTSANARKIYIKTVPDYWIYFSGGSQRSILIKKDWDKVGKFIAWKMLNDDKYFGNIKNKINQEEKNLKNFFQKQKKFDLAKLNFKQLVNLALKIQKRCIEHDSANILAWFVAGDKFHKIIKQKTKIPKNDFIKITSPAEKSEGNKLEMDLLRYVKLAKTKRINIDKAAEKLSDDYGWLPFGYDGPEYWDKKYFLKKLTNKVKNYSGKIDQNIKKIKIRNKNILKRKNEIIKKYKLSNEKLKSIEKLNSLIIWTDQRKKNTFKLYYYYSKILLELEKRYKIPYKNLKYLFTEELIKIKTASRQEILETSNFRINNDFILAYKNGKGGIMPIMQQKKLVGEIKNQIDQSRKIKSGKEIKISGITASTGPKKLYVGQAKVVLLPTEGRKVKSGDFLIATMTSPDYILAMKRASGFITNEGGVTCHAAIIAREMNKPCIVGTGNATKVLKDGDEVEVDADEGIVKILKRK